MELSIEFLPKAVKNLESHQEALRIKKFVYCLTKQHWENDFRVINRYSLDDLIFELIRIQPTINRLSLAMYDLVKCLNHQKKYAEIANTILEEMALIYNATHHEVERSKIYHLIKKEISQNHSSNACINLMEVLVKEAIFNELEKLSPSIHKSLNSDEVIAYALNRLPPLYICSEEERIEQMKKVKSMRERIHLVVKESIQVIINRPAHNFTPLKMDRIFSRRTPH
ncbi:MAG: late competence development ComFB family protein [Snowella sp.]|nr:late competence development ComFB family protein [Snowella sp.]